MEGIGNTAKADLGSWASEEIQRCPFPFLHRLIEEKPVYPDPQTGLYIVTRYDDVSFIAGNPNLFSTKAAIVMDRRDSSVAEEVRRRFEERGFPEVGTLSFEDPPVHTKQRALVDKVFTPSTVRAMEPRIEAMTNQLIDAFIERGEANILTELAVPLPMFIIADQLGVPREDWARFQRWSDWTVERNNPLLDPKRELEIVDELIEMQNYLYDKVKFYREHPADNLITKLVHAQAEDESISEPVLMNILHIILVGGNETTTNAIMHSVNGLLTGKGVKERVEQDHKLIPALIEESLRLHAPVPHLWRIATEDTKIGDVDIPKGAKIQLSWQGANLDPAKWENPDELNLDRKGIRNHLTFGRGAHFCVGFSLARAEVRIAITALLTRLRNLGLSPDHPKPEVQPHFQIHRLGDLHVRFAPGLKNGG